MTESPLREAPPRIISILGATGSIGRSALEIVRLYPGMFQVRALAAHSNTTLLLAQAREFHPQYIAVHEREGAAALRAALPGVDVLEGPEGIEEIATLRVDIALFAIVGAAGLRPLLRAIEAGIPVAVANKEPLVMAGGLVMAAARRNQVPVLPVDSEHNAIFQCLAGHRKEDVYRIHLTASGGPFYGRSRESLAAITPEEATVHPTWVMGAKISVDSATLMNKGLEIVEAMWLFDLPVEKIAVVIHPQSVIHSLVEFTDGHILAHLGVTDMKLPILFALSHPNRVKSPVKRLELTALKALTFAEPRLEQFPCLEYACDAAREGGSAPAVLNAANEVAVSAFCQRQIGFLDISEVVRRTRETLPAGSAGSLEAVLEVDALARRAARQVIETLR